MGPESTLGLGSGITMGQGLPELHSWSEFLRYGQILKSSLKWEKSRYFVRRIILTRENHNISFCYSWAHAAILESKLRVLAPLSLLQLHIKLVVLKISKQNKGTQYGVILELGGFSWTFAIAGVGSGIWNTQVWISHVDSMIWSRLLKYLKSQFSHFLK